MVAPSVSNVGGRRGGGVTQQTWDSAFIRSEGEEPRVSRGSLFIGLFKV